ncbi:MAG: hypothetical protein LBH14_08985 [Desulfobulbaceae bacterium]|jgi:fibronectin type 3 domain-containing protein|nr:hypothetical protein [Desulfobulbaceae bacterium]
MRAQCKKAMAIACGLLLALVLSACGYKNLPVPPEQVVPKAIMDLRFVSEGQDRRLEWTYPLTSVTGEDLAAIDCFELFQTSVAVKDYCPSCPIPFGQPQTLPAGETTTLGKKRTASFKTPSLTPGNKYFFKVRSRTSWWVSSDDSNVVTLVWTVAASAPQNLSVKAGSKNIALSWQAVTAMTDGSPLTAPARYQVQRSDDGKTFTAIATAESPLYVDNGVSFGHNYSYRVLALTRAEGVKTEGGMSNVVAATLTSPPLPPSGVGVAVTSSGARVYWDRVENAAGYRLYRRAATERNYQPLAEARAEATIFIDKSAQEGVLYYYVITTVDANGEESAQSRPAASRW